MTKSTVTGVIRGQLARVVNHLQALQRWNAKKVEQGQQAIFDDDSLAAIAQVSKICQEALGRPTE